MSKFSYIVRMDRPRLERIVVGCLRATILAHGPITEEWIGSAAKRVAAQLIADVQQDIDREKGL